MHLWMATPDRGLAATLYGPCSVKAQAGDGVPVKIACATGYPFEEEIRIEVNPDRPAEFPLYLRVPGWCASPSIEIGSNRVDVAQQKNGFVRVQRMWKAGDAIRLTFPMSVRITCGRETPYPRAEYFKVEGREASKIEAMANPYASVHYGPLLFALPIADKDPDTPEDGANWKYALDGTAGEIKVARRSMPKAWSWQLDAPIVLKAPARTIDWNPTNAQPLPAALSEGKDAATVSLVPYGCTKFRISMFPVTQSTWSEAGRSGG
jgi:hypothetical protein